MHILLRVRLYYSVSELTVWVSNINLEVSIPGP